MRGLECIAGVRMAYSDILCLGRDVIDIFPTPSHWWRGAGLMMAAALLGGCVAMERPEFGAAAIAASQPTGAGSKARSYADQPVPRGATVADDDYAVLALSGGGPDGAYGAGLLKGWSESGKRPRFAVVTGVSTGALIAPLAFAGPEYDDALARLYTGEHLATLLSGGPGVTGIIRGPNFFSNKRLSALIAATVDAALLADIARQHRAGRRLYVMTANLDAERLAVWDMGAIAASDDPGAPDLFRSILLAAASIPVALPPVPLAATSGGTAMTELHADATLFRLFYFDATLLPGAGERRCASGGRRCAVYVIAHNKLVAEPRTVKLSTPAVLARAVATIIKAGAGQSLLLAQDTAGEGAAVFNLAYVRTAEAEVSAVDFDPEYMARLYAQGRAQGRDGSAWTTVLPRNK